jgi:hypothetical protein
VVSSSSTRVTEHFLKEKYFSGSRGSISISGLALPLKADFIRMLQAGGDDTAHYFVVLVKCRGRVIATQMLSTLDGINNRRLVFPNLINLRDLEFDFEVCALVALDHRIIRQ